MFYCHRLLNVFVVDGKTVSEDFVLTLETSMDGETMEKVPVEPRVTPSAPVAGDNPDGEEEK